MLVDERFQSSMESEEQCHWLPVQILNAVHNTSMLPDATQVDVMKVSLVMVAHTQPDTLAQTYSEALVSDDLTDTYTHTRIHTHNH